MPWRNGHPAMHQRYSARTICCADYTSAHPWHRDILLSSASPRQATNNRINYQKTKTNHSVSPGLLHILPSLFILYFHTVAVRTPLASPTNGGRLQVLRHAGPTINHDVLTWRVTTNTLVGHHQGTSATHQGRSPAAQAEQKWRSSAPSPA